MIPRDCRKTFRAGSSSWDRPRLLKPPISIANQELSKLRGLVNYRKENLGPSVDSHQTWTSPWDFTNVRGKTCHLRKKKENTNRSDSYVLLASFLWVCLKHLKMDGWNMLEYDRFLLGFFRMISRAFAVSFRECKNPGNQIKEYWANQITAIGAKITLYICNYIYLEPKWPWFWLEKALFWGGWPSKIGVIGF